MTALRFAMPLPSLVDNAGLPISGGTLEFYIPETDTPKAVYLNKNLVSSPVTIVTLDAAGRMPEVYIDSGENYKTVIKKANGELVRTIPHDPHLSTNSYSTVLSAYSFIPYKGVTIVNDNLYSHFPSLEVNNGIAAMCYYQGLDHGSANNQAACLPQTVSGAGYLAINGDMASGGQVVLGAGAGDGTGATRFSITSTADDSSVTFTITKEYQGVLGTCTITGVGAIVMGVHRYTIYGSNLQIGEKIISVHVSGACSGQISCGLYMINSDVLFNSSLDGGSSVENPVKIADGMTTGKYRHYSQVMGTMADGRLIVMYLEFDIEDYSYRGATVGNVLGDTYQIAIKFSSDNGATWTEKQYINLTDVTATTTISMYGNIKRKQDGTLFVGIYAGNDSWMIESTDGVNWVGQFIVNIPDPITYGEFAIHTEGDKDFIAIARRQGDTNAGRLLVNRNYGRTGYWEDLGAIAGIPTSGGYVSPALNRYATGGQTYLILTHGIRSSSSMTNQGGQDATMVMRFAKWEDALQNKGWSAVKNLFPAGTLPDRSQYPSIYINPVTGNCLMAYGQEAGTGTRECSVKLKGFDLGSHIFTEVMPVRTNGGMAGSLMNYGGKRFRNNILISAITKANPGVLTVTSHGLSVNDYVYIEMVGGMVELTDGWYYVKTIPTASTMTLSLTLGGAAIDTSTYTTYTTGGRISKDYMTGALSGISDSKFWHFRLHKYFADKADGIYGENIFSTTGTKFRVWRNKDGFIQVLGVNAAGTTILNIITTTAVALQSGMYIIETSGDMADQDSACIRVNKVVCDINITTYTDDTIDYTVANYSIGASVSGTSFCNGNIYTLLFDNTAAVDLKSDAVSDAFADCNMTPFFLDGRGQNCMATPEAIPILFHAYDSYLGWKNNKGSGTITWTQNGALAAVSTALYGQKGEIVIADFAYTPVLSGSGTAGSPTYTTQTAYWSRRGKRIKIHDAIVTISAIGGMVGTTQFSIPFLPAAKSGNTANTTQIYYGSTTPAGTTAGLLLRAVAAALLAQFFHQTNTASATLTEGEIGATYQVRIGTFEYETSEV